MSAEQSDHMMTVKEVAHYLKLAKSTVYKLLQNGTLPARKVGGAWRISRQQLDAWMRGSDPPTEF